MNIEKIISHQEPKYSYVANAVIEAYNVISKARSYCNAAPLPLSTDQIISYLQLNDCPVDVQTFCDCIYMIDADFIDRFQKQIAKAK